MKLKNDWKLKPKFAVSLAGLCIVLAGCGASSDAAETVQPEKVIQVNVLELERGTIEKEISYPGQAKASDQIAVIGKIQGKVDEVYASVGDYVEADAVLFTMDATDLSNNIKSLEAQLVTAEAGVRSAQTGVAQASGSSMQSQILQTSGGVEQAETAVKQSEKNNEQSKLALEQAQISYDNALKTYNDTSTLYDAGAVSRTQFEQAETGYKNAQIALDQSNNNYNLSQIAMEQAKKSYDQAVESHKIISNETPAENLRRAQDAVAQATAQKNSIEVSLATARKTLEDLTVRTPISGVVSTRNVEPKTMLSSATVPFTIVSTNIVEVRVNVTETVVNKLSEGMDVPVYISAASDSAFTGKIVTLSPAASEANAGFEVRLAIENTANLIKPGMYAEAHFIRDRAENALIVPRGAIVSEESGLYVYTVDNDIAQKNPVTTGIDTGTEIEITEGLSAGDMIVIKGQNYLGNGTKTRIEDNGGDDR